MSQPLEAAVYPVQVEFGVAIEFSWYLFVKKKKYVFFILFQILGCIESKNKTNCERKSAMSPLNPSIIRFGSFKCKAGVPLVFPMDSCWQVWQWKGIVATIPFVSTLQTETTNHSLPFIMKRSYFHYVHAQWGFGGG